MKTMKQDSDVHLFLSDFFAKQRTRVSYLGQMDEDSYQDAALRVLELDEKNSFEEMAETFIQAYKTICLKRQRENFNIVYPDDYYWDCLPSRDTEEGEEMEESETPEELAGRIMVYVRANFPKKVVQAMDMRFRGFTFFDISSVTGMKYETIVKRIEEATKKVVKRFANSITNVL